MHFFHWHVLHLVWSLTQCFLYCYLFGFWLCTYEFRILRFLIWILMLLCKNWLLGTIAVVWAHGKYILIIFVSCGTCQVLWTTCATASSATKLLNELEFTRLLLPRWPMLHLYCPCHIIVNIPIVNLIEIIILQCLLQRINRVLSLILFILVLFHLLFLIRQIRSSRQFVFYFYLANAFCVHVLFGNRAVWIY